MSGAAGSGQGPLVIGYDGSDDAANAIAWAGRLLAPRRALVVHSFVGRSQLLLRSEVHGLPGPLAEAVAEFDAADTEEAERLAGEGAKLAAKAGLEPRPLVVRQEGAAWRTLVATADEHAAAAIVAGARGRSAFASALLGSVSTGLANHAPFPLLLVPAAADKGDSREHAARVTSDDHILLAYDGSTGAKAAIDAAGCLLPGRRALVVTVWRSAGAGRVAVPAAEIEEAAAQLDTEARQRVAAVAEEGAQAARRAGLEADGQAVLCHGNTWATLVRVAQERGAAAIVVGSRGRSAVGSVLLGSVSSGVTHHSPVPVLIAPAPVADG